MSDYSNIILQFEKVDSNRNLMVDNDELESACAELQISPEEIEVADTNKDGFLHLSEWMDYKQKNLSTACSSKLLFANDIHSDELEEVSYPYDRLRIVLSSCTYLNIDFGENGSIQELRSISASIREIAGANSYQVLGMLPAILKAGFNTPDKIKKLIESVYESAESDKEYAIRALPHILNAGITEPSNVTELIKTVRKAGGHHSDRALDLLPLMLHLGLTNQDDIVSLISSVRKASGGLSLHAFTYLRDALRALSSAGITGAENITSIIRAVSEVAGENSGKVFKALPAMLQSGISKAEDIVRLVKAVHESANRNSGTAFNFLPALLNKGVTDPKDIAVFFKTIFSHSGTKTVFDLDLLPTVLAETKHDVRDKSSMDKLMTGLKFILEYSGWLDSSAIIKALHLDVAEITYKSFPEYITTKFSQYVENKENDINTNVIRDIAVWFNNIHDADNNLNRADDLRMEIIRFLNPRASYILLALGGPDLHTTTFLKLLSEQNIDDISAWLNGIDPNDKYTTEFILSMCNFNETELFKKSPSFFISKSIDIIKNSEDPVRATALLIKLFDKVIPIADDKSKDMLSSRLLDVHQNNTDQIEWSVNAYLIRLYGDQLGNAELEEIATRLKTPLKPSVPRDKWLADGALTAKLYFYNDESWFGNTKRFYRDQGWIEDTKYIKEKGLNPSEYSVYKKSVWRDGKQIVLRVVLTNADPENDNRLDSINEPEFDIIVHRGHSYHFDKTFPSSGIKAKDKLVMGGSCGSFRDMTESNVSRAYIGNYKIADQDTGEGAVNNRVLTELMLRVARGCEDWGECLAGADKKGLVMPNDPSFLINEYIADIQTNDR